MQPDYPDPYHWVNWVIGMVMIDTVVNDTLAT